MQCLSVPVIPGQGRHNHRRKPSNISTTTTRSRAYSIAALLLHLYSGITAVHAKGSCSQMAREGYLLTAPRILLYQQYQQRKSRRTLSATDLSIYLSICGTSEPLLFVLPCGADVEWMLAMMMWMCMQSRWKCQFIIQISWYWCHCCVSDNSELCGGGRKTSQRQTAIDQIKSNKRIE